MCASDVKGEAHLFLVGRGVESPRFKELLWDE
jgi:hypothetical protein